MQTTTLPVSPHTRTHTHTVKSTSTTGKPSRKRKPTQKSQEADLLKSKKHSIPLKAPSNNLRPSDWESSDEEIVLPFLDSSLTSVEDKLDCGSDESSWVSSDSDRGESDSRGALDFNTITPNPPTNRLMSSSSIANTPSFLTEPPNYLPETPTVATPTFMDDIGMEDDSDVLSQQLMKGDPAKWLNSSSDSRDSY